MRFSVVRGTTVIAFLIVVAYVAVLLGPLACDAQPALKVPRIGMINEFSAAHPFVAAFRRGLAVAALSRNESGEPDRQL
jgi:hypothetical protein